ncbi:hypothetical protein PQX77_022205 [Marasmius sp. AFHP31]|nr:hypothetical protein PQX77_022205 [Marasmius sp. AFHP31]
MALTFVSEGASHRWCFLFIAEASGGGVQVLFTVSVSIQTSKFVDSRWLSHPIYSNYQPQFFLKQSSFQSSSCRFTVPISISMSSEDVGTHAKKFEKIFSDYTSGNLAGVATPIQLARRFREEGATVAESEDYVKQAQIQFISPAKEPEREKSPSAPETSGEQGSREPGDESGTEESQKRNEEAKKAFEETQWANYLRSVDNAGGGVPSSSDVDAFLSTVLPRTALFSLPPGLAGDQGDFESLTNSDPHVARTISITRRFIQDKSELDLMLLKARSFQLIDPLSHSVWKEIILDRYVNFDKLNYTLQPGYNQSDEPKLELGDLVISDKSRISSKKPITSLSDWSRVFGAWAQAVSIIYPHRLGELRTYHLLMSTFFRNHPSNPLVGIRLDDRIREAYSRCPFRLDDRGKFSEHTIAQLSASSDIGKRKEAPSGLASLPKRPAGPICLNWNGNRCKDPCPANRRHGLCCQCSGSHRAWDNPDCRRAFNGRFQLNRAADDSKQGLPGPSA